MSVTEIEPSPLTLEKNQRPASPVTLIPNWSCMASAATVERIEPATSLAALAMCWRRVPSRPASTISGSPPRSETRLPSADSK